MLLFIKLTNGDKGNKGNWGDKGEKGIYILSNLLILMSDYVAYLIFPAQFIFLLFNRQKRVFKSWVILLSISVLLCIWWLPIFLSQLNIGSTVSANLPVWKLVVGSFSIKSIVLTVVKFIIGRVSISNKEIYYLLLIPICILFLFIIIRGIKCIKNNSRYLLINWLLIPIFLAALISFFIPIFSYFRLIFTLPPFIILLSLGIISFKHRLRYLFLGSILLIQVLSSFIYLFNTKLLFYIFG